MGQIIEDLFKDPKFDGWKVEYGFLYSFEAAQKAVPEGWRLPSDKDWQQLEQALGLSAQEAQRNNAWRGAGLGTAMSEGGASGFNAPLGGANAYQKARGQLYLNRGKSWYYWTSTPVTLNDSLQGAIVRISSHFNDKVWRGTSRIDNMARSVLYSVRCVKDVTATNK